MHTAIGGDGEEAVPGDLLCGALASCVDSSVRLIANRLGVQLRRLQVEVKAEVDVRGTLLVSKEARVGFTAMRVNLDLALAEGTSPEKRVMLLQLTEKCCVVMETLREGVPITMEANAGA